MTKGDQTAATKHAAEAEGHAAKAQACCPPAHAKAASKS
jgi:hypothetical protein